MPVSAKSLYDKLATKRQAFLNIARKVSELTVPTLIPREGKKSGAVLDTPAQGIGARGVKNLASKFLLTLLPTNESFFRFIISPEGLEIIKSSAEPEALSEIETNLSAIEKSVTTEIEVRGLRPIMFETFEHLVVSGNGLLKLPNKGKARFFPLTKYVCDRNPESEVQTVITLEHLDPMDPRIPEGMRQTGGDAKSHPTDPVELHTITTRNAEGKWDQWQEVGGIELPKSRVTLADKDMDYIVLRMNHVSGEDYGRGIGSDYLGDLISLEGLTKAIVEGSAAMSKLLFMVNPNGYTRKVDLTKSGNGEVITGRAEDVSTLQADKFADFRVAFETMAQIRDRLGFAFLLNSSVQRNAERVTAEEIRFMAQELEDALGGAFSILSQEFQLPLVERLLEGLKAQGKVPKLPPEIRPTIVTGIDALGRGHELQRLQAVLQILGGTFGPESLQRTIKEGAVYATAFHAAGLDPDTYVNSEEDIQQTIVNDQVQALAERAAPQIAGAIAPNIVQPEVA